MSRGGKIVLLGLFFLGGILLAWIIYQVPQPWRAILVAWLFVFVTLGTLILRAIQHYYAFQTRQGKADARRVPRRKPKANLPSFEGLRVVMSQESGQRFTIR